MVINPVGEWKYEMAVKDQLFSRYGLKSGTYVSPIETPFGMRGLSPNTSPYLKMNIKIFRTPDSSKFGNFHTLDSASLSEAVTCAGNLSSL